MPRYLLLSLLTVLFTSLTPVLAEPDTTTEQRIISLAPHITEMLYSAGAGQQLVGVVSHSDYPPAARQLPVIGGYNGLNIEKILDLKPDIIIAWNEGNRGKDIQRLESLGLNVWRTDVSRLDDIPNLIETFGQHFHSEDIATPKASQLREELTRIKRRYDTTNSPKVFYQIWNKPLITINGQQFISQGIALCGGENVFSELTALSAEVSLESVINQNPEVILLGGTPMIQKQWTQSWQAWTNIKAVKNNKIIALNADLYQRPTERFILSLDTLCQSIHR